MITTLITAIENSDVNAARTAVKKILESAKVNPWDAHNALYPLVQRVTNPPFINPHLPKMYAINQELASYLKTEDLGPLLALEVEEYARREKFPSLSRGEKYPKSSIFDGIIETISQGDVSKTAGLMKVFFDQQGGEELARKLLLLGSGYVDSSLGHSISCSAFILLEMIRQGENDPWPALATLADYFCKGGFYRESNLQTATLSVYREAYLLEVERAVSGTGIVELHHTITLYAIERCRYLFAEDEYEHLLTKWAGMMKNKRVDLKSSTEKPAELSDYSDFAALFVRHKPESLIPYIKGALNSKSLRYQLGGYIVKGVLELYNGKYNPHSLTGLGSALWVMDTFSEYPKIVINGWLQYLDFFYSDIS